MNLENHSYDAPYYLGVDPGKSGAWAILDTNSKIAAAGLWAEIPQLLAHLKNGLRPACAALEKCGARPRQGTVSTCTFCESIGVWKGIFAVLELSWIEVTPMRWQHQILDFVPAKEGRQGEEDSKQAARRQAANRKTLKNAIVDFVKRRYPDSRQFIRLEKHQGIADAICLAEYARRS